MSNPNEVEETTGSNVPGVVVGAGVGAGVGYWQYKRAGKNLAASALDESILMANGKEKTDKALTAAQEVIELAKKGVDEAKVAEHVTTANALRGDKINAVTSVVFEKAAKEGEGYTAAFMAGENKVASFEKLASLPDGVAIKAEEKTAAVVGDELKKLTDKGGFVQKHLAQMEEKTAIAVRDSKAFGGAKTVLGHIGVGGNALVFGSAVAAAVVGGAIVNMMFGKHTARVAEAQAQPAAAAGRA